MPLLALAKSTAMAVVGFGNYMCQGHRDEKWEDNDGLVLVATRDKLDRQEIPSALNQICLKYLANWPHNRTALGYK